MKIRLKSETDLATKAKKMIQITLNFDQWCIPMVSIHLWKDFEKFEKLPIFWPKNEIL